MERKVKLARLEFDLFGLAVQVVADLRGFSRLRMEVFQEDDALKQVGVQLGGILLQERSSARRPRFPGWKPGCLPPPSD